MIGRRTPSMRKRTSVWSDIRLNVDIAGLLGDGLSENGVDQLHDRHVFAGFLDVPLDDVHLRTSSLLRHLGLEVFHQFVEAFLPAWSGHAGAAPGRRHGSRRVWAISEAGIFDDQTRLPLHGCGRGQRGCDSAGAAASFPSRRRAC